MLNLDARQRAMLEEMGIALPAPGRPEPPEAISQAAAPRPAARATAPRPPGAPRQQPAAASPPVMDAHVSAQTPARHVAAPAAVHAAPSASGVPGAPEAALSERARAIAQMDWPALKAAVAGCEACGLCRSRTHTVFGVGAEAADWMIIGEAPGENEDRLGEPFVGQAGKLLDRMLAALHLARRDASDREHAIYIANVLKCRPPRNRNPEPQEMAQCEPYLKRQIALVQPKVILAMGRFAVQALLQTTSPIGRLRGSVHHYQGVPTIVTYHPAYLLRNPADKGKSWADLCLAAATLAQSVPAESSAG